MIYIYYVYISISILYMYYICSIYIKYIYIYIFAVFCLFLLFFRKMNFPCIKVLSIIKVVHLLGKFDYLYDKFEPG